MEFLIFLLVVSVLGNLAAYAMLKEARVKYESAIYYIVYTLSSEGATKRAREAFEESVGRYVEDQVSELLKSPRAEAEDVEFWYPHARRGFAHVEEDVDPKKAGNFATAEWYEDEVLQGPMQFTIDSAASGMKARLEKKQAKKR
jgi:hypothetical protein